MIYGDVKMMNRFQDLMRNKSVVRIIVDTVVDKAYVQIIEGTITQVGNSYLEIERDATPDEKSRHKGERVKVLVPFSRISETICYGHC